MNTPLGVITLFEDTGALVALEWGRTPGEDATPLLDRARALLNAYFDGNRANFDLPLRPAGTPFQRTVWEHLRRIPCGETTTYGQLANALDTAPRAAATACGRNPIPIIIPCHRVVGVDSRLGGYSGGDGVITKETLLRLEGIAIFTKHLAQDLYLARPRSTVGDRNEG
jgi:methylated-DNA-[protein]-cysteine S-methyltransferase